MAYYPYGRSYGVLSPAHVAEPVEYYAPVAVYRPGRSYRRVPNYGLYDESDDDSDEPIRGRRARGNRKAKPYDEDVDKALAVNKNEQYREKITIEREYGMDSAKAGAVKAARKGEDKSRRPAVREKAESEEVEDEEEEDEEEGDGGVEVEEVEDSESDHKPAKPKKVPSRSSQPRKADKKPPKADQKKMLHEGPHHKTKREEWKAPERREKEAIPMGGGHRSSQRASDGLPDLHKLSMGSPTGRSTNAALTGRRATNVNPFGIQGPSFGHPAGETSGRSSTGYGTGAGALVKHGASVGSPFGHGDSAGPSAGSGYSAGPLVRQGTNMGLSTGRGMGSHSGFGQGMGAGPLIKQGTNMGPSAAHGMTMSSPFGPQGMDGGGKSGAMVPFAGGRGTFGHHGGEAGMSSALVPSGKSGTVSRNPFSMFSSKRGKTGSKFW